MQAVPASPQPVIALAYIVQIRHKPVCAYIHVFQVALRLADEARDHDVVHAHAIHDRVSVQQVHLLLDSLRLRVLCCQALQFDRVVGRQSHADIARFNLDICGGYFHPCARCAVVLLQHVVASALVNPQLAVCRVRRRRAAHGDLRHVVVRPIPAAHCQAHAVPDAVPVPLHASAVAQVHGVEVHFIRPDANIRAHAHDLLRQHARAFAHCNPAHFCEVVIDFCSQDQRQLLASVNPVQLRILAGIFECGDPALFPLCQQRVSISGQVLHVEHFPVLDDLVMVVSLECRRHEGRVLSLDQIRPPDHILSSLVICFGMCVRVQ